MKFTAFIFLFNVLIHQPVLSQDQVTFSSLIESSKSYPGEPVLVTNKIVIMDDLSTAVNGLNLDNDQRIIIPSALVFQNCNFKYGLRIVGLSIPSLSIMNSKGIYLEIGNCNIQNLYIDNIALDANLLIANNTITNPGISNNHFGTTIELFENDINGGVNIGDNVVNEVYIENNEISLSPGNWFNNYAFNESENFDLHLINNVFHGDSTNAVILSADYLNLRIVNNIFNPTLFLSHSGVQERFQMVSNQILSNVSFEDFLFSETRNEVYWDQMANYRLAYSNEEIIYKAETDAQLSDNIKFKNLISNYKVLHNIFLARGDLESANACYDEMKELQGKKLRYIYQQNGTFANFFRWQLNRLLKVYTNHGTDPALAVVISFYVILVFTFLYLFFPSEWDKPIVAKLTLNKHKSSDNTLAIKGYILHFVNALTLSINSFVTLGFGSIPTRGLARYLCIIEGFLGWFLLSIFTVALINQVLA